MEKPQTEANSTPPVEAEVDVAAELNIDSVDVQDDHEVSAERNEYETKLELAKNLASSILSRTISIDYSRNLDIKIN